MIPRFSICLLLLCGAIGARDSVLVWSEEFATPGLPDPSRWDWDEGGSGMGNKEAQFYTRRHLANARVEGGQLVITARRQDTLSCWYGPCKFTSARLVTRGIESWLYGKVEVRALLPKGKGVWPAIWMLPEKAVYGGWPASGEIDIMEHVGHEPGKIYGTVHTEAFNHVLGTQSGASRTVSDPTANWHVYGLEWGPDSLSISVDGQRIHRFANGGTPEEWPFDQPFHLLLNFAVGGEWGGAQGIDSAAFPQEFRVDWVRVHKIDRGDGPYTIEPLTKGMGQVTLTPAKRSYMALDTVFAQAVPDKGFEFVGWRGLARGTALRDTILADHSGTVEGVFLPEGERIANGGFDDGWAGWKTWNDAAVPTKADLVEGRACFSVNPVGAEAWMSQVQWPGLSFAQGETWELSFSYEAARGRPLTANLVMDHEPFSGVTTAWTTTLPAGASRQTHRFAVRTTDPLARFEIDFATDTTRFCLDSLSLRRVGASSVGPRTRAADGRPGDEVDASGRKLSPVARPAAGVRVPVRGGKGAIAAP